MPPNSAPVSVGEDVLAVQYNDLRDDTLDEVTGHGHTGGVDGGKLLLPAAISPQGVGSGLDADLLDGIQGSGYGRFLSDTFVNRPAFGVAGRQFYATDLKAVFFDTGSAWVFDRPLGCEYLFDDFVLGVGDPAGADAGNASVWDMVVAAAGEVTDVDYPRSVIRLASGATSSGSATIRAKRFDGSMYAISATRVPALFETELLLPGSLANARYRCGLYPTSFPGLGSDPTDGVYFRRLDGAGEGNWFAVSRASSAETVTDTGVASGASWTTLGFEIVSTSLIRFYVNGTLVASHSTHIPTANLRLFAFSQNTTSGSNKIIYVDRILWAARRS